MRNYLPCSSYIISTAPSGVTFGKIHSSVRASDLLFHLLNSEQQLLHNLLLVVIFVLVFFQHLHLLLQLLYLQLKLLFLRDLQTIRLCLADAHLVYLSLEVRYLLYFVL